jgi:hypothetical protein
MPTEEESEKFLRQAKRRKRGPLGIGWGWWSFSAVVLLPLTLGLLVVGGLWWVVPAGAIALQLLIGLANLGEEHGFRYKDYGKNEQEAP